MKHKQEEAAGHLSLSQLFKCRQAMNALIIKSTFCAKVLCIANKLVEYSLMSRNAAIHLSPLFEKGSRRNSKSHFGAFNTQWKLVSNWNPSLKYLSTFHLLTKLAEISYGVKGDAKAAGNKLQKC